MQVSSVRRKKMKSPRQQKVALIEAIEKRRLLSVTLTGYATSSGYVKTSGFTSSSSIYVSNTSKQVGANALTQSYSQEFGYFEFGQSYTFTSAGNTYSYHQGTVSYTNGTYSYNSSGVGFYPSGFQVGSTSAGGTIINGGTLTLVGYNSSTYYPSPSGTTFELYLATNSTLAPSLTNITYNPSYSTGVDTSGNNSFAPIYDVGAFSFAGVSNATASYALPTLTSAAQQLVATDINSGLGVRFLIGANGSGASAFYNRFEGDFLGAGTTLISGTNTYNATPGPTPELQLSVNAANTTPDTLSLAATTARVNETAGNETFTINRTIGTEFDQGATVSYSTADGTGTAGTNYTAESGNITFSAGQTTANVLVPILEPFPQGGNKTFTFTLSNATNPTNEATVLVSGQTETTTIVDTSSEIDTKVNNQTVAENAGTVAIEVTRSIGTGFTDSGATATYATSNLTATAGTNYAAESGLVSFSAGQTTAYVNVPIYDEHPQFGTQTFLFTISNPDADSHIYYPTTTVSITDDDATEAGGAPQAPTANGVQVIEASGSRGAASYFDINGSTQTYASAGFGVLDFNDSTVAQISLAPGEQISDIESLTLDLWSYKETNETAGTMNVYLASNTSEDISANNTGLAFETSDGHNSDTSSDGVGGTVQANGQITGSELGTLYPLGSISENGSLSQSAYTPFNLTNIPLASQDPLIQAITNGSVNQDDTGKFRIVVTPGTGNLVAGFNGTYVTGAGVTETPEVDINYYTTPTAYVAPGHGLEYSTEENTLYVYGGGETGAAPTITADPGSVEPNVDGFGSTANLTFGTGTATSSYQDFHIGGLTLTGGAKATVASLGAGRTNSDYSVLVLGTSSATTAPTFNIDSTSKLDLADNDLLDLYGSGSDPLGTIQSDINTAADGGAWDQPGLTSSVAAANNGSYGLGYADASTLPSPENTTFDGVTLGSNAVVVKYTLLGDTQLRGQVGIGDYDTVLNNFGTGTTWSEGDFHYGGQVGIGDYDNVLNNFGGTVATVATGSSLTPSLASSPSLSSALVKSALASKPAKTDIEMVVNTKTGDVYLKASKAVAFTGYSISDLSGHLKTKSAKFLSLSAKDGGNTSKYEKPTTYEDWTTIAQSPSVLAEGQANNGFGKHSSRDDTIDIPAGGIIDLGDIFNIKLDRKDLGFAFAEANINGSPVTGPSFNGAVVYVGSESTSSSKKGS